MPKYIKSQKAREESVTECQNKDHESIQTLFAPRGAGLMVGLTVSELEELLLQTTVGYNRPFEQFDNKLFRNLIH